MPLVSEFFNGGIVTVRDPAMLKPGELQQADECVYRAHTSALFRAPGRTSFNMTAITDAVGTVCPVKGLAWLPFSTLGGDVILALGGSDNGNGRWWAAPFTAVDGSAVFATVTGPGQVTIPSIGANSTTLTATGAFLRMVVGARVYGANIAANTTVTVVTPNTITLSQATTNGTTQTNVLVTFDIGIMATAPDTGLEQVDAIQWNQSYYVYTGQALPQRMDYKSMGIGAASTTPTFLARPVGLDPVVAQPTVTRNSGAGHSWSAVLGNGWYWFLVTEVYNPGQPDEVEGTYVPKNASGTVLGPVPIQITDYTTQDLTVTRPTQVNTGANSGRISTHWRIYMSPPASDGVTVPSLATFVQIAEVSINETFKNLSDVNSNATYSAAAITTVAGRNQWDNSTNMLGAANNTFALGKSGSAGGSVASIPSGKLTTFSIPTSTNPVLGVMVTVIGKSFAPNNAGVNVYVNSGGTKTSGPLLAVLQNYYNAAGVGGPTDTLGVAWVGSDFTDASSFNIIVEKSGSAAAQIAYIDTVLVTIFYSGVSINLNGKPFRTVTYRDQVGNSLTVPARLPPVVASTGDIFQGSIVTNDTAKEDTIRWTLPGEPEAMPDPYVLKFNERRHNKVNFIRRVGQILVVGLSDAVKRVNYLPSEQDLTFQEGLAHEDLASDHGIVGPLAGCLFTFPGAGTALAYVGENGLHMTDGVTTRFLNIDLLWTSLVEPSKLNQCILRDYPQEQWLVLYYTPLGGTVNSRAIVFSYSIEKIKDGGFLPAIGPISVGARSAAKVKLANKYYLLTGHHADGDVFVEDSGFVIPTGYTSDGVAVVVGAPKVRTRQFYPAGIDRVSREERIYVHFAPTGSLVVTTDCTFTKGSPIVTMTSTTGLVKGMLVVTGNVAGDSIILSVDNGTQITISTNANESGVFSTGFDNAVVSVTVNRENIGENVTACETSYNSMRLGSLLVVHPDNQGQALELQLSKVVMPDASFVDAGVDMRLNFFCYDMADAGKEQNRAGS